MPQAAWCDPNPCQATPPSNAVACCLTNHDGETGCEVISAEACMAAGGTPGGVASCHPDPCGSDGGGDGGGDDGGGGGGGGGDGGGGD